MHQGHRTGHIFIASYIPWINLEILPYTHGIIGLVSQQLLQFQGNNLKLAAK